MGNKNLQQFKWEKQYQVLEKNFNDGTLVVQKLGTQSEFLAREIVCSDKKQSSQIKRLVQLKINNNNPFLTKLLKVHLNQDPAYCSSEDKIYLLFEKPRQTLKEQILARKFANQKFSEQQADIILQSGIKAIKYLKQIRHEHNNISTSSIFIDEERRILLGDPWITPPTYSQQLNQNAFACPSPQKILFQNDQINNICPYRSDLFSLGTVVLEALNFQHMDVLYEKGFRKVIEARVQQKLMRIRSEDLRFKLSILLSHDPRNRDAIYKQYKSGVAGQLSLSEVRNRQISKILQNVNIKNDSDNRQIKENKQYQLQYPAQQQQPQYRPQNYNNAQRIHPSQNGLVHRQINYPHAPTFTIPSTAQPLKYPGHQNYGFNANQLRGKNNPKIETYLDTRKQAQNTQNSNFVQQIYNTNQHNFNRKPSRDKVHNNYSQNPPPTTMQIKNPQPTINNYIPQSKLPQINIPTQHPPSKSNTFDMVNTSNKGAYISISDGEEGHKNQTSHNNEGYEEDSSLTVIKSSNFNTNNMRGSDKSVNNVNSSNNNIYQHTSTYNFANNNLDKNSNIKTPIQSLQLQNVEQAISRKTLSQNSDKVFLDAVNQAQHNSTYQINYKNSSYPTRDNQIVSSLEVNQTPERRPKKRYNSTIKEVDQNSYSDSKDQHSFNNQRNNVIYVQEDYDAGTYHGEKKNGLRNGYGKFYYNQGSVYEGQWKNNQMHGRGKLFYSNGKVAYDGEWKEDQFHGQGKVYNEEHQNLPNGSCDYTNFELLDSYWVSYEGDLNSDRRHGKGKIKFSNGEIFSGNFVYDMADGEGKFFKMNGDIVYGVWQKNKLIEELKP